MISFWRHRNRVPGLRPTAPDGIAPDMEPQPLEGYTNAYHYHPGQTVTFYLKALQDQNHLQLQYLANGKEWQTLAEHAFDALPQPETFEEAQQGCQWQESWHYNLPLQSQQGYYRALLVNPVNSQEAQVHFIVGQTTPTAKVAVLAPVTTWLAYNAYGGQSLYRNAIAPAAVPFVSAHRPNTALTYGAAMSMQHSLLIESNIFYWMAAQTGADLLPDYILQSRPQALEQYQVLVLAYHAEYFSQEMYESLRNLVFDKEKSLLALGGNQIYWQVRWHQNYSQLECRKDASHFMDSKEFGKLFRHTAQPEVQLLGVQFSESGMGTFAPYSVITPDHWLFKGCHVQMGQTFGHTGIDHRPICGDETDKATWGTPKDTIVLAKGLNKETAAQEIDVYDPANPDWKGSGGGEIAFTPLSDHNAVLSTGSIHSGAGLGHDEVFTCLIRNFIQKYV